VWKRHQKSTCNSALGWVVRWVLGLQVGCWCWCWCGVSSKCQVAGMECAPFRARSPRKWLGAKGAWVRVGSWRGSDRQHWRGPGAPEGAPPRRTKSRLKSLAHGLRISSAFVPTPPSGSAPQLGPGAIPPLRGCALHRSDSILWLRTSKPHLSLVQSTNPR
jgi:hypothetical protein